MPSWSVWTWSLAHYLHRWLTANPLRGFLRLATATFATSSDVRVKEEIPGETGVFFLLVVERIVADSGIFRIFAG